MTDDKPRSGCNRVGIQGDGYRLWDEQRSTCTCTGVAKAVPRPAAFLLAAMRGGRVAGTYRSHHFAAVETSHGSWGPPRRHAPAGYAPARFRAWE